MTQMLTANYNYKYKIRPTTDPRIIHSYYIPQHTGVYPVREDWVTSFRMSNKRPLLSNVVYVRDQIFDVSDAHQQLTDLKLVLFPQPVSGYVGFLFIIEIPQTT